MGQPGREADADRLRSGGTARRRRAGPWAEAGSAPPQQDSSAMAPAVARRRSRAPPRRDGCGRGGRAAGAGGRGLRQQGPPGLQRPPTQRRSNRRGRRSRRRFRAGRADVVGRLAVPGQGGGDGADLLVAGGHQEGRRPAVGLHARRCRSPSPGAPASPGAVRVHGAAAVEFGVDQRAESPAVPRRPGPGQAGVRTAWPGPGGIRWRAPAGPRARCARPRRHIRAVLPRAPAPGRRRRGAHQFDVPVSTNRRSGCPSWPRAAAGPAPPPP